METSRLDRALASLVNPVAVLFVVAICAFGFLFYEISSIPGNAQRKAAAYATLPTAAHSCKRASNIQQIVAETDGGHSVLCRDGSSASVRFP